jgi:hypothetical protein
MLNAVYSDCYKKPFMLRVAMLYVIMLSVVMLFIIILSVVMLYVIMLSVVMLNITGSFSAPHKRQAPCCTFNYY